MTSTDGWPEEKFFSYNNPLFKRLRVDWEQSANHKGGFAVHNDEGWRLSVQWGPYNYCDLRDLLEPKYPIGEKDGRLWWGEIQESPNAELGIINPDGKYCKADLEPCDYDEPVGWVTPKTFFRVLARLGIDIPPREPLRVILNEE